MSCPDGSDQCRAARTVGNLRVTTMVRLARAAVARAARGRAGCSEIVTTASIADATAHPSTPGVETRSRSARACS